MHPPRRQDGPAPLPQQRPVCGQAQPETQVRRYGEDFPQPGVQQRLPHDVKIQVSHMSPQLLRQQAEPLRRHELLFPSGARTEGAAEVAHIGDFNISPLQHRPALLCVVGLLYHKPAELTMPGQPRKGPSSPLRPLIRVRLQISTKMWTDPRKADIL